MTDQLTRQSRSRAKFASKEVAVVSGENRGAAVARNHALSLSQGDYIQWLDADDLLSPEKVAKQTGGGGQMPRPADTSVIRMGLLRLSHGSGRILSNVALARSFSR